MPSKNHCIPLYNQPECNEKICFLPVLATLGTITFFFLPIR